MGIPKVDIKHFSSFSIDKSVFCDASTIGISVTCYSFNAVSLGLKASCDAHRLSWYLNRLSFVVITLILKIFVFCYILEIL